MSTTIMAVTRPSAGRPTRAIKVPEGGKSLVSGPKREDQKQRQTAAPG